MKGNQVGLSLFLFDVFLKESRIQPSLWVSMTVASQARQERLLHFFSKNCRLLFKSHHFRKAADYFSSWRSACRLPRHWRKCACGGWRVESVPLSLVLFFNLEGYFCLHSPPHTHFFERYRYVRSELFRPPFFSCPLISRWELPNIIPQIFQQNQEVLGVYIR